MAEWVNRTFKHFPWADYCLNCQGFVICATPCLNRGHIVVTTVRHLNMVVERIRKKVNYSKMQNRGED